MVTGAQVLAVLRGVEDPEMPISIVDLGIMEAVLIEPRPRGAHVEVRLVPTFIGCPALDVIRARVTGAVAALPGVADVAVRYLLEEIWTVERISDAGRATLHALGITTPVRAATPALVQLGLPAGRETVPVVEPAGCPFCGAAGVVRESSFGPTRCKMIYYCPTCKHPFEHMKAAQV